jgi:hypothetical protein
VEVWSEANMGYSFQVSFAAVILWVNPIRTLDPFTRIVHKTEMNAFDF